MKIGKQFARRDASSSPAKELLSLLPIVTHRSVEWICQTEKMMGQGNNIFHSFSVPCQRNSIAFMDVAQANERPLDDSSREALSVTVSMLTIRCSSL
jgi:hypothetical protein